MKISNHKFSNDIKKTHTNKGVFIPISYVQWFNSFHNKTKAFPYMSKESFKYYYRWCEFVSKNYN